MFLSSGKSQAVRNKECLPLYLASFEGTVELVLYETKNENLECLSVSVIGTEGGHPCALSGHLGNGGSL